MGRSAGYFRRLDLCAVQVATSTIGTYIRPCSSKKSPPDHHTIPHDPREIGRCCAMVVLAVDEWTFDSVSCSTFRLLAPWREMDRGFHGSGQLSRIGSGGGNPTRPITFENHIIRPGRFPTPAGPTGLDPREFDSLLMRDAGRIMNRVFFAHPRYSLSTFLLSFSLSRRNSKSTVTKQALPSTPLHPPPH